MCEAFFAHEGANQRAPFGTKGQRVALLLNLIQRLYFVDKVIRREVVQLVWRLRVAEDHYEGAVEELGAINFDLVGKCVSWELCDVSFEVQNVQA